MKLHHCNRRQEGKEGHGQDKEGRNLTDTSRDVIILSTPIIIAKVVTIILFVHQSCGRRGGGLDAAQL